GFDRRRASWADAGEIVSETFLVAWRRLDDLPGQERPWLLGIARKALANRMRTETRQRRVQLRLAAEPPSAQTTDTYVIDGSVHAALARLSAADRDALTLLAWDELTPAEVAVVLDCTRAAAYVRIHRARRRFAIALAAIRSAEGDHE